MPCILVLYWLGVGAVAVGFHLVRGPLLSFLPTRTRGLYVYGKLLAGKVGSGKNLFLVPKRLFTSFYALGVLWASFSLGYTLAAASIVSLPFQSSVIRWLLWITRDDWTRSCNVLDGGDVVFVTILFLLQVGRRLYECLFVLVQSQTACMNILQFLYGHTFYFFVAVSPFAQAPFSGEGTFELHFFTSLTVAQLLRWTVCLTVFVWASYHQHRCHRILGDLRQKPSQRHRPSPKASYGLPCGDWFDHVSSPHYLAETIIYISFAGVLGGRCWLSWAIVWATFGFLSVVALETQNWYQQAFEDYPKARRAMIPYLL